MDEKIWILLGLVWLLWVLIDARRNRPSQPNKVKRFELFHERPIDLKDAIYHPKEWRKPRK